MGLNCEGCVCCFIVSCLGLGAALVVALVELFIFDGLLFTEDHCSDPEFYKCSIGDHSDSRSICLDYVKDYQLQESRSYDGKCSTPDWSAWIGFTILASWAAILCCSVGCCCSGPGACASALVACGSRCLQSTGTMVTSMWRSATRSRYELVPQDCVKPWPDYWRAAVFHEVVETSYGKSAAQRLLNDTYDVQVTRDRHGSLPAGLEVVKVERIEDSTLWERYAKACLVVKRRSEGQCPSFRTETGRHLPDNMRRSLDESVNEVVLFHGTTESKAKQIRSGGFKLTCAGTNRGSSLGKGIYFAEKSTKSDEYTETDRSTGLRAMLLCRVCLGRVYTLDRWCDGADILRRNPEYDSIMGSGKYNEYVIFNSDQSYPEYVIYYKHNAAEP